MPFEQQSTTGDFPGFDVIDFLGEGSYGKVYRAIDAETGLEVGLKVINRKALENDKLLYTLDREVVALRTAQNKNLTNIIRLYSKTDKNDFTTLILEYASLGDLSSLIKCYRVLPEDWTRFLIAEIILGLEGLHSIGYCHRDIKPSNILLTRGGHVRIADFGTSKQLPLDEVSMAIGTKSFPPSAYMSTSSAAASNDSQGTLQKKLQNMDQQPRCSIYGTVCYNAPESNRHGLLYMSPQDVWGLGCILYECLTGMPAFMGDVELAIMQAIEKQKVIVPKTVSPDAADLIKRLLTKDPTKRFNGGWRAIKKHPFFTEHNVDFANLNNQMPPFNPSIVFSDLQEFKHMKVPKIMNSDQANMLNLIDTSEYRSKDSPLRRFLIPGENIIYSIDVVKRRVLRLPKQRRFVLTDFPRLFYIDVSTMVQKGEIDMTSTNLKITRIGERTIEFTLGQNCFTAEVLTKDLCDLWLRYMTMYSVNGKTAMANIMANRANLVKVSDQDMRCEMCKGRLFKNGFCNTCGNVAQVSNNGSSTIQYILKMDPRWLPVSEKEIRLHSRLALISGIQPEMDNIEAMSRYETRSSVQKAIDRLKKTQEDVVVYKNRQDQPLDGSTTLPDQQSAISGPTVELTTQEAVQASSTLCATPELKELQSGFVQSGQISQLSGTALLLNPPLAIKPKPASEKDSAIYGTQLPNLPNMRRSSAECCLPSSANVDDEELQSDMYKDQARMSGASTLSSITNRQSMSVQVISKQEKDLFEFFHANDSLINLEESGHVLPSSEQAARVSVDGKSYQDGGIMDGINQAHLDSIVQQVTLTSPLHTERNSASLITPPLNSCQYKYETPVYPQSSPNKAIPQKQSDLPTDIPGLLTYMDETPGHSVTPAVAPSGHASAVINKRDTLNSLQSMILGEFPELPTNVANQSSHIRITTASTQAILGSHSYSVRCLLAKIYAVSSAAELLPYPTLPLPRILGYCGDRLLLQYRENIGVIGKFLTILYVLNNKQAILPPLGTTIVDKVEPHCICICQNERRVKLSDNIDTNYDVTIRHASPCYTCGGDVFKELPTGEIINDALLASLKSQQTSVTQIPTIVFPQGLSTANEKTTSKAPEVSGSVLVKRATMSNKKVSSVQLDDEIPLVSRDLNEEHSTNSYMAVFDKRRTSNTVCIQELDTESEECFETYKHFDTEPSVETAVPLSAGLKFYFHANGNTPVALIPIAELSWLNIGASARYCKAIKEKVAEALTPLCCSHQRKPEVSLPGIMSIKQFQQKDKWCKYLGANGSAFELTEEIYKIGKLQDLRFLLEMNTYHKQVSFDVTIQYDESSDGYFNALYLDECMRSSAVSATTAYTVEDLGTSTGTSIHNHNKPDTVYQHMVEDYTQSSFKLANKQPYIHYCRRCVCSECISKIEQKDCFIKLEAVEQKSAFIASEFGKDEYSFELFRSWVSRRFPFQFREGNFPLRHRCRYEQCKRYVESIAPCGNVNLRLPFVTMARPADAEVMEVGTQIPTSAELDEYWVDFAT